MATQRISIVKVAGMAGDHLAGRLRGWMEQRTTQTPTEWSTDQWPQFVRVQIDNFAALLRENSTAPPVVHFVEWIDLWSMGDLFQAWFSPRDGEQPLIVFGDQFEVYAYRLPDDGCLLDRLNCDHNSQFPEAQTFQTRLRDAVVAWESIIDRSLIVVLRKATGGLVTDEDVVQSLLELPDWLAGTDNREPSRDS